MCSKKRWNENNLWRFKLDWCYCFCFTEYYGTFTAELKKVIDIMFGWITIKEGFRYKKYCVLLMTARGNIYSMALVQYNIYIKYLVY